jgi:hypothetical protein
MIKTYDLYLYFNGYSLEYNNLSRVAVKHYIDWYSDRLAFFGYDVKDHESLVSN